MFFKRGAIRHGSVIATIFFSATASLAQTCPNDTLIANEIYAVSASDIASPRRLPIIAGGDINLSTCALAADIHLGDGTAPYGFTIAQPDFTLVFGEPRLSIELATDSGGATCDTILLVRTPDGEVFWNDDLNGIEAGLSLALNSPGELDVWVGTFAPQFCESNLVIVGEQIQPERLPPNDGGSTSKPETPEVAGTGTLGIESAAGDAGSEQATELPDTPASEAEPLPSAPEPAN